MSKLLEFFGIYNKKLLKKWFKVYCPVCGWKGISRDVRGGQPLHDTGDYEEITCPKCFIGNNQIVEDYADWISETNLSKRLFHWFRDKYYTISIYRYRSCRRDAKAFDDYYQKLNDEIDRWNQ